jgi:sigma-B regulation protein RsbU (phosphoserine phosphatase)
VRPPAGGMGSEGSWALEARMELESDPVPMKAVRVFLDEVVTEWKLELIRDDALLVATELATDAVLHAGTKVRVTPSSDGAGVLRIEVGDLNTCVPSPAESADRSAPIGAS